MIGLRAADFGDDETLAAVGITGTARVVVLTLIKKGKSPQPGPLANQAVEQALLGDAPGDVDTLKDKLAAARASAAETGPENRAIVAKLVSGLATNQARRN